MQQQCINTNANNDICQVHKDGSPAVPPTTSVVANLQRNWQDTYGGHLGASYWLKPEIELFAGVGYETAASPDATMEPGSMDANNIQMAVGGRFFVLDYFYLGVGYTQIQFLDRTVTDSQLSTANGMTVSIPTYQEDGNGTYTQWVGVVDINVEKQF
jgi:long-chain fatty acid transport protein